jgi:hypothetical protein
VRSSSRAAPFIARGIGAFAPAFFSPGGGRAFCSPIKRYQSLAMQICPHSVPSEWKVFCGAALLSEEQQQLYF